MPSPGSAGARCSAGNRDFKKDFLMAKTKKAKSAAAAPAAPAAGPSAAENVRAAFDRYREQMKGKAQATESKLGASPSPAPMFAFQPVPGQVPGAVPWMPMQSLPSGATGQTPLFESVGQMLRLGVSLANAVFAGGLQLMQGFNGPMMGPAMMPGPWGGPFGGECRPHGMCGCGWEPESCGSHSCGCHPGVHNCCR